MHDWRREFTIACLNSRRDEMWWDAAEQVCRQTPQFSWREVLAYVEEERVGPLLYDAFQRGSPAKLKGWEALRPLYDRNAGRNTILCQEIHYLVSRLVGHGFNVILLKGMALLHSVYAGNIALRPMADVDILVRQDRVQSVLELLQEQGFVCHDLEAHAGLQIQYENELLLQKPGVVDLALELHWHLLDSPFYQRELDVDWFWDASVPVSSQADGPRMLTPEAQLLHLCAHVLLHHQGTELLWLNDIADTLNYYREELQWDLVLTRGQLFQLLIPLQTVAFGVDSTSALRRLI